MAVSIASSVIVTLKSFNEIVESTKKSECQDSIGPSIGGLEDELGRLRIWAANIGAHQKNQSSLDFRLRDSSHIRDQILELLDDLRGSLDDAREILNEDFDGDDVTMLEYDSEGEVAPSDMEELHKTVASIVKSLFMMSMLVRQPAQHDLRTGSSRAEVAAFKPYDYGHVRDKYPRADEALIQRLGSAITQRRMYLKYRERHAAKLKQGLGNLMIDDQGAATEGDATVMSDTIVSNAQNSNIDFDERASNSGDSQTSYAATLMSGGNITIPAPPNESQEGRPFECPLCYYIIKIKSAQSWNKHVFFDLQPYLCLERSCKTPQKLYGTRHEWLHHRKSAHPAEIGNSSTQRVAKCELCAQRIIGEVDYTRHCARHLQDLALFVLPSSLQGAEENEKGPESNTEESAVGEINPVEVDHNEDLALSGDDEEYPIKCFCGFQLDDGNTVLCDRCDTWQHIECYYFDFHQDSLAVDVLPLEHLCVDCEPRPYDKRSAIERLKSRIPCDAEIRAST